MSHAKHLHHRRYLNDYLEIINREGLPSNIQNDWCLQVQEVVITTRRASGGPAANIRLNFLSAFAMTGNRRHRKMQKSVYRVRSQVSLEGRIALDMMRESRAENRARTTQALHQTRRDSP